jgi:hypothetical protein
VTVSRPMTRVLPVSRRSGRRVMGAGRPAVPGDVEDGWQAPTAMSGPEVGPGDGAAGVVQCGGALGGGQGGGAGVGVLEVDVVGEVAGDGNGRGVGVVPVGGLVQAAGVGRVGQDEAYAGAPAWVHGCVRLCVLWVPAASAAPTFPAPMIPMRMVFSLCCVRGSVPGHRCHVIRRAHGCQRTVGGVIGCHWPGRVLVTARGWCGRSAAARPSGRGAGRVLAAGSVPVRGCRG